MRIVVSILYEADRLCNKSLANGATASGVLFQSSTRQTDFATPSRKSGTPRDASSFNPLRGRQTLQLEEAVAEMLGWWWVSILYEADRLCNTDDLEDDEERAAVSILYEADRLCNRVPAFLFVVGHGNGFNPLRGRQTLQQTLFGDVARHV